MKLSTLQKYILRKCLESRGSRATKKVLSEFYKGKKKKPKKEDQIGIITKSVERLIFRGLIRGYGIKTKERWFIEWVALTPMGRKALRELFGKQQELPLKIKKKK